SPAIAVGAAVVVGGVEADRARSSMRASGGARKVAAEASSRTGSDGNMGLLSGGVVGRGSDARPVELLDEESERIGQKSFARRGRAPGGLDDRLPELLPQAPAVTAVGRLGPLDLPGVVGDLEDGGDLNIRRRSLGIERVVATEVVIGPAERGVAEKGVGVAQSPALGL